MATCDPSSLSKAAVCFCGTSRNRLDAIKTYLLCNWSNLACTPPHVLDFGAVEGVGQISFNIIAGVPAPTVSVIIRWGTTLGGPYPNSKSFPVGGPYVLTVAADGLVVGTTYYFIAIGNDGLGCHSGNSNEDSASPLPPAPPGFFFSYTPNTATITWTDNNGSGLEGDLAFFNANADIASVSVVSLFSVGITSISHIQSLPALTQLTVATNPALTVLDVSGMPALTVILASNCGLITPNLTGCTGLTVLDFSFNAITSITGLSTCTALTTFLAFNNLFATLNLTTNTALATLDLSNNLLTAVTGLAALTALVDVNLDGNPNLVVGTVASPSINTFFFGNGGGTSDVVFSVLVSPGGATSQLNFTQNPGLHSVATPLLTYFDNAVILDQCPALVSLPATNANIGNLLQISQCPLITSVSFGAIVSTTTITVDTDSGVTSASFAALHDVTFFTINNCNAITGVSLPLLKAVYGVFAITANVSLAALDLSSGIAFGTMFAGGNIQASGNTALASVNLAGATFPAGGGSGCIINFNGCALNQASVNAILALAVAQGFAGGDSVVLDGGTNSPPINGVLNADYLTLTGAGCAATINP